MKNKPKICLNCISYKAGMCGSPESFQFEDLVSEDYCCHAFEFKA